MAGRTGKATEVATLQVSLWALSLSSVHHHSCLPEMSVGHPDKLEWAESHSEGVSGPALLGRPAGQLRPTGSSGQRLRVVHG